MKRKLKPCRLLTKAFLGLTIIFTIFISCKKESENTNLITNKFGIVRVYSCAKGCQQFLISISNELYYPVNLPATYWDDDCQVIISAEILDTKGTVFKPDPDSQDDSIIVDFYAKEIKITQISRSK